MLTSTATASAYTAEILGEFAMLPANKAKNKSIMSVPALMRRPMVIANEYHNGEAEPKDTAITMKPAIQVNNMSKNGLDNLIINPH